MIVSGGFFEEQNMITRQKNIIISYIVLVAFFAVMLIMGSVCDLQAAMILYSPSAAALALTIAEMYIFFGGFVFFLGVLLRQAACCDADKRRKAVYCGICVYLEISTGTIGAGSLLHYDCIGALFPQQEFNFGMQLAFNFIVMMPLFILGCTVGSRKSDKTLCKRIIAMLAVMTVGFLLVQLIKTCADRPRYRLTLMGYDGIGFSPWYIPFENAAEYMSELGINSNEFCSFPSGHAFAAVMNILFFSAMKWVIPRLRGKEGLMTAVGIVIGFGVILSRMLLGAHYLSDVSAGALMGIAAMFVYNMIEKRIISDKISE